MKLPGQNFLPARTLFFKKALPQLLLLLSLLSVAQAAEVVPREPWHLGVVVDCSEVMDRPWQGSTRLLAAEAALKLELRTLPLRARVAVWLAGGGEGQTREFVAPAQAGEVKGLGVILPSLGGKADLAAGVAKASAWIASQGQGAVVVMAGPGGLEPGQVKALPVGGGKPFAHALCLGPEDAAGVKGLEELALKGGGAYFEAARPDQASPLAHRAMILAVSPARLLVLAHDASNQPRRLVYGLERLDQLATRRRGLTQQEVQLLPGVYKLSWAEAGQVGPGPLPAKASLGPSGQTRLWVGGAGSLAVKALDAQGRTLPWAASVANLDTGKVEASEKRTPFEITLPAGYYRVKTTNPPMAWTVELGAGKEVDLVVGPQGRLNLRLTGPSGQVRAPYVLEDLMGVRAAGSGYTNQPLKLLPGRYRLTVGVAPPLVREVNISPGQELEPDLPPVGGLVLRREPRGLVLTYELTDPEGRTLATGASDRVLYAQPGRYLLRLKQPPAILEAEVEAGRLTALDPPPK